MTKNIDELQNIKVTNIIQRKFTSTGSEMEKVKLKRSHSHSRAATSIGIHAGKLQHATIVLDEMRMVCTQ